MRTDNHDPLVTAGYQSPWIKMQMIHYIPEQHSLFPSSARFTAVSQHVEGPALSL